MKNRKNIFTFLALAAFLSISGMAVFAMNENQINQDDLANRIIFINEQFEFDFNDELKNFCLSSTRLRDSFQELLSKAETNSLDLNESDLNKVNTIEKKIASLMKKKEALHRRRQPIIVNNNNVVLVDNVVVNDNQDLNNISEESGVGLDLGSFDDEPDAVQKVQSVQNQKNDLNSYFHNQRQKWQKTPSVPPLTPQQKERCKQKREELRKDQELSILKAEAMRKLRIILEEKRLEDQLNNICDLIHENIKSTHLGLEKCKNKLNAHKIEESLQRRLREFEDIENTIQAYKIIARQGFKQSDKKKKQKFIINDILTRYGRKDRVREMVPFSGLKALINYLKSWNFWKKNLSEDECKELRDLNNAALELIDNSLDLFEEFEDFLSK